MTAATESTFKNLLGLEGLGRPDLNRILDAAEGFVGVGEGGTPKRDDLKGARSSPTCSSSRPPAPA